MTSRRFGKYKAKVISTNDLTVSGKLLCAVPDLPGMLLNWATPCVPYAGIQQGFFALPEEGSDVWIEFEQGNPDHPIWSGGFWEPGEEPVMPEIDPEMPELVNVLRSKFSALVFDDTPEEGGVRLTTGGAVATVPVLLAMGEQGLSITVGELSLTMDPEVGITLTAGDTSMTLSPEGVELRTPAVTATVEETVALTADSTEITGDVTVTGATEFTGDVTVSGAFELGGDASLGGALEVAGDVNTLGALGVEGDANFAGLASVEGDHNVAGALTVEGDVNVAGAQQTEGNNAVVGLIEGVLVPPI